MTVVNAKLIGNPHNWIVVAFALILGAGTLAILHRSTQGTLANGK